MNLEALHQLQYKLLSAPVPVKLVAVTKYFDVPQIKLLIQGGVTAIAENRLEVAVSKFSHLPTHLEKHFIGQIQSKKIGKIVRYFDVIQSVASNEHLLKIDQEARTQHRSVRVLLQFNISGEFQKTGYTPTDLDSIRSVLDQLKSISVIGVMGMAGHIQDELEIRRQFRSLKVIRDQLMLTHASITELSMGMSSDYSIALDEGATMLRLGSIFSRK